MTRLSFLRPAAASEAVTESIRAGESDEAKTEKLLNLPQPETTPAPMPADKRKFMQNTERLVADDFPFDPSQLAFIDGIISQQYACGTGAAGTGKTTCTKAIVDRLIEEIGQVNMQNYWRKADAASAADDDDSYEMPEHEISSVCLVGFTGRSAQMIKRNFPRSWHGNIMTIHRMLGFMPVWYEEFDEESGDFIQKMRFEPTYNRVNKLPWDVIIIDEAGMLGIDLWEQIWDAVTPTTRIYMIGDINQLPPVHGRSAFGFAMSKWPSFELTKIHRQAGVNNAIVDNAWEILRGFRPNSEMARDFSFETTAQATRVLQNLQADDSWKFVMIKVPENAAKAARSVTILAKSLQKLGIYEPNRDSIIVATNGKDGSRAAEIGQEPLNLDLSLALNLSNQRYIIDAGRERKRFAIGDKVMATKNDHEIGITNGMTGVITEIVRNAEYTGEHRRFGLVSEVNQYLADCGDDLEEEDDFTLADLTQHIESEIAKKQREKSQRGAASHIVTVQFGSAEHPLEVKFATLTEVESLIMAYAVTCHKMQGGEAPLCITLCHQGHAMMLYREWLYTAVTRSSQRHILLYTDHGLRAALSKQKIKGKTLGEKIASFQLLQSAADAGAAKAPTLPEARSLNTDVVVKNTLQLDKTYGKQLDAVIADAESQTEPTSFDFTFIIKVIILAAKKKAPDLAPEPIELKPIKPEPIQQLALPAPALLSLPAPKSRGRTNRAEPPEVIYLSGPTVKLSPLQMLLRKGK